MSSRQDMGSWLEGPPTDDSGIGLPETGPGSSAGLGRRVLALAIDWLACLLISASFFDGQPMATLAVFTIENIVLVSLGGATLGHRIAGLQVRRLEVAQAKVARPAGGVGLVRGAVRAVLLSLVIPAVAWDAQGRGLHDRLARTVITHR